MTFIEQTKAALPVNWVNLISFLLLLPEPDGGERVLGDLVWDALAGLALVPVYVDQPFQHLDCPPSLSSSVNIHQSLVLTLLTTTTTDNGQIIKHKSLIFLLWHCCSLFSVHCTVLGMIMNKKDLGNSKDSAPASQPFRVEWLHLISSDAIIAVKISTAAVGCKLTVRRWREEKAGGGHVTTKIRLTATVAADRRGALHLPGYTRLTKHHQHQHQHHTTSIGPFS